MAFRDRRELIPSPLSPIFPCTPSQTSEWRSTLSYVQWLFLKGQYKRTIMECRRLLTSRRQETTGLYTTYICFYAALSAEALARLAHPLALTRMESLELAKKYYEAARKSMPTPAIPRELRRIDYGNAPATESNLEVTTSDTASVGDHEQSITRTRYSASSIQSESYIADTLFPKPPSIRSESPSTLKDDQSPTLDTAVDHRQDAIPSPVPSHLSVSTEYKTYQARQQSLEYTSLWLQNKSIDLFNNHLADFKILLSSHLATVDLLIGATREGQSMRHTTRRLAGFGDDQEAKDADRRDRLQRLKANGWSRERFRPEYYEELRDKAMADLMN